MFGKSTQDGIPSLDNPVPIASVGDKGSVRIKVGGSNILNINKKPDENFGKVKYKIIDGGIEAENFESYKAIRFIVEVPPYTDITLQGKVSEEGVVQISNYMFDGTKVDATISENVNSVTVNSKEHSQLYVSFFNNIKKDYKASDIMLSTSKVSAYEPYKPIQTLAFSTPSGLSGIKVDFGGNYTDSTGQQWVCDEVNQTEHIQRIGRITSYNNETIDTAYMSTTGELSVGAEVIYILKEPIVTPLTSEKIAAYKALHTNYPTTTVLNDENADMELTYTVDTQIADISRAVIAQKGI